MSLWDQIRKFVRRPPPAAGPPRILAYCASNIGMGHYVRLVRVLEEVKRRLPAASVLLATDARDDTLTQRIEVAVLQLPRFRFLDHERFKERPDLLNVSARDLQAIRAELLAALGRSFRPDVLIMDTNPHGKRDEALALLKELRGPGRCRRLLLMRDIPAPPGERFKLSGAPAEIRRHAAYYDRLLFAGDEKFFDVAAAYAWPDDVRARMRYVGFVVPPADQRPRAAVLAQWPQLDPARPTVVVSFGGGWQAEQYAAPLLEGLRLHRERGGGGAQMILAAGPALAAEHLDQLRRRAEALGGVAVERFSEHFPQLLRCADFAILQAGSAPFLVLEGDMPVLLTSRPFKSREQQERAERLARWPGIRLEPCEHLTPAQCAEWIGWGFGQPRRRRATGFCYDGVANAAAEVLTALNSVNK